VARFHNGRGLLRPVQHLVELLEVDAPENLINGGLDLEPSQMESLHAEALGDGRHGVAWSFGKKERRSDGLSARRATA
jgi:hypothetical protein